MSDTEEKSKGAKDAAVDPPAPPPDDQNVAVSFGAKTFLGTMVGAILWIAAALLFVL